VLEVFSKIYHSQHFSSSYAIVALRLIQASATTCKSFLGLASYYWKFVKDLSKIAKPLFNLTKKEKKFIWEEGTEAAFQELKNRLISAPILAFPQANGSEFILDTDASAFSRLVTQ
jgi:hypothetical protein